MLRSATYAFVGVAEIPPQGQSDWQSCTDVISRLVLYTTVIFLLSQYLPSERFWNPKNVKNGRTGQKTFFRIQQPLEIRTVKSAILKQQLTDSPQTNAPTTRFPPHSCVSQIWVPSEFNRETFTASGVPADKLFVLPEGIDTAMFDPSRHKPLSLSALMPTQITGVPQAPGRIHASRAAAAGAAAPKPYIFLSIFKWELRKGWPILLKVSCVGHHNLFQTVLLFDCDRCA